MERIIVYTKDGSVRHTMSANKDGIFVKAARHEEVLMASDIITIEMRSVEYSDFSIGDYIIVGNGIYKINQAPRIVKDEDLGYNITIDFESSKYDLVNVIFLLPDEARNDYLTATFEEVVRMIVDNANRVYPSSWEVVRMPKNKKVITKQFTEMNCLMALQRICDEFNYEFRILENGNQKKFIDIYEEGNKSSLQLSYGRANQDGLISITREATTIEDVSTRIFFYGSSQNLPYGYPHTRLCLPEKHSGSRRNQSFLQDNKNITRFGLKESVKIFDDVMPRCRSIVQKVVSSDPDVFIDDKITFDLMAYWKDYEFKEFCEIRGYDFNDPEVLKLFNDSIVDKERKYIVDGKATITFNTGNLSGYSFTINSFDFAKKTFKIDPITINEDDPNLKQRIPSLDSEAYRIQKGDEYVISDINLPIDFVYEAENELSKKAEEYYAENAKINARYSITFNQIYLQNRYPKGLKIHVGDFIRLKDDDLDIDSYIKVIRHITDMISGEEFVEISDIKKKDPNTIRYDEGFGIIGIDPNIIFTPTKLSCAFTPNYNAELDISDANSISIEGGTFTNSTLTGKKRIWNIPNRVKADLNSIYAYKIFVKAAKKTDFAYIYFESILDSYLIPVKPNLPVRILKPVSFARRDDNYYYFEIGSLSKPSRRISDMRLFRHLVLEYGFARMSANDVTNGDIILKDINGESIIDTIKKKVTVNTLEEIRDGKKINIGNKVQSIDSTQVTMKNDIGKIASTQADSDKKLAELTKSNTVVINKVNEIVMQIDGIRVQKCDQSQCKEVDVVLKPIDGVPILPKPPIN